MKILFDAQDCFVENIRGYEVLVSVQKDPTIDFEKVFSHKSNKSDTPLKALKFVMANFDSIIKKGLQDE